MRSFRRIIREIHHRSLWQVLSVYVVASWVVLQVVETLGSILTLPEWFPGFAVALLLIGLPLVLATAFVQEGAPGSRRDPEEEPGGRAGPSREEQAGGIPAAPEPTGAGSGGALTRIFTWKTVFRAGMAALALWGVVALGWMLLAGETPALGGGGAPEEERASIAVLPFTNLAGSQENQQFTAGLHDDILTQLSQIGDLRVTSRTSVQEYRDTEKNVRQIARELGVGAVLEGGVQRAGNLLRVNVQLIDAETDEHLWASRFTRELNLQNIFDIQSEIAVRVAEALRTELTAGETARIERRPTGSMEAYDLYLRARAHRLRRHVAEDAFQAVELLERAVDADPEFAGAWALLADSRLWLWWYVGRVDQLEPARAALERAVALAPNAYETVLARGNFAYRADRAYDRALQFYRRARELNPSDSEVLIGMGSVYRRIGRWEDAARQMERAATLDPASHDVALTLGDIYRAMRRYEEAERAFDRGISMAPELPRTYYSKLHTRLMATGDTVEARRAVEGFPASVGAKPLLRVLVLAPMVDPAYYRGDLDATLELWQREAPGDFFWHALLHSLRGDERRAGAYADSIVEAWRPRLEGGELDAGLEEGRPSEIILAQGHSAVAAARALRGEEDGALEAMERARELLPLSRDALVGARLIQREAVVRTLLRQHDRAVAALDTVLSVPSDYSAALLRIEPLFAPLRTDPDFRRLVSGR